MARRHAGAKSGDENAETKLATAATRPPSVLDLGVWTSSVMPDGRLAVLITARVGGKKRWVVVLESADRRTMSAPFYDESGETKWISVRQTASATKRLRRPDRMKLRGQHPCGLSNLLAIRPEAAMGWQPAYDAYNALCRERTSQTSCAEDGARRDETAETKAILSPPNEKLETKNDSEPMVDGLNETTCADAARGEISETESTSCGNAKRGRPRLYASGAKRLAAWRARQPRGEMKKRGRPRKHDSDAARKAAWRASHARKEDE